MPALDWTVIDEREIEKLQEEIADLDAEIDRQLANKRPTQWDLQYASSWVSGMMNTRKNHLARIGELKGETATPSPASYTPAPALEDDPSYLDELLGVALTWNEPYPVTSSGNHSEYEAVDLAALDKSLRAGGQVAMIDHEKVCRGNLRLYVDYIGLVVAFNPSADCPNSRELVQLAKAHKLRGMSFNGIIDRSSEQWRQCPGEYTLIEQMELTEVTFGTRPGKNARCRAGLTTDFQMGSIRRDLPITSRLQEIARGAQVYRPGRGR